MAGVPGEVLVLGVLGVVLLVVGVYMLKGARHAQTPSTTTVTKETEPEPQKRSRPPSSPTGTYVDRSGDRDEGPPSPEEQRMDDLESRIKAIDRRMSQAKVKLGTGELSPEGYQKVMEELEEKRAELEKRRVDLELDQSDL